MLDIKWIRNNPNQFRELLKKRNITSFDIEKLLSLDEEKRQFLTLIQSFQHSKNKKSKLLMKLRGSASREFLDTKRDIDHINEKMKELTQKLSLVEELNRLLDSVPNILDESVPEGKSDSMNHVIKEVPTKIDIKNAKDHLEVAKSLNMIELEKTSFLSGARFVSLKSELAELERALINYMLDHNKKFKFQEISVPFIVKKNSLYKVGQLPKFQDDLYMIEKEDLGLIPTGEVPLLNMVGDEIFKVEDLPIRYVGYTACFRKEAGAAGKETKGLIRNHQFGKVELVSITTELESKAEHQFLLNVVESLISSLKLPYRIVLLCSGDTGFTASKTFDIEIWCPGMQKYLEISSISNCQDFQARRMKTKYKNPNGENSFVHTLNASALAIGRTIVAILENYQNDDGSVTIPEALRPYINNKSKLSATVKQE